MEYLYTLLRANIHPQEEMFPIILNIANWIGMKICANNNLLLASQLKLKDYLIDKKIELSEEAIAELDMKLSMLADRISSRPKVAITHFHPDAKKEGGAYVTTKGALKRIDSYEHAIVLDGGEIIKIPDILDIESELFENL